MGDFPDGDLVDDVPVGGVVDPADLVNCVSDLCDPEEIDGVLMPVPGWSEGGDEV